MFNISQNQDDEALKLINKVYDTTVEDDKMILEILKGQSFGQGKKSTSDLSFYDAVFGPKYWRTTFISIIITIVFSHSGFNVFLIYSTRLFVKINESIPDG